MFADFIIIADQQSTDNSKLICSRFPKVKVIENENLNFNEAERQVLLIQAARDLFPEVDRILFCIDADEIITADSINSTDWEFIRKAEKGSVFRFEKPTLFFDTPNTIRYFDGWPLAYKDDGAAHNPSIIHSIRVPTPEYAKQYLIKSIKFVHLCFVRTNIQFSKNRFYCATENYNNVSNLWRRRIMYNKYTALDYASEGELQPTPRLWFEDYTRKGLEFDNIIQHKDYWMDFEVLKIFNKYGTRKFFNDSIWHFDWEACRQEALAQQIPDVTESPIIPPSQIRIILLDIFFKVFNRFRTMTRIIKSRTAKPSPNN